MKNSKIILEVNNLSYSYRRDGHKETALSNISFSVNEGDFIAIEGPSGSGKSTLFYILGCLLRFPEGTVTIEGQNIQHLSEWEKAVLRNRTIGFVFQDFHLLPHASVLENIMLPTFYPCEIAIPKKETREAATYLAKRLGIESYLPYMPNQLSGGQQQRVAIARALVNDARIVLADEPTGSLDRHTANETMKLLKDLNKSGKTIILITHDPSIAKQCSRTLFIRNGILTERSSRLSQEKENPTFEIKKTHENSIKAFFNIIKTILPLAIRNVNRNRLRSWLSMIGVTIGISAVLATLTFGQFVKQKILESYEPLGVNKLRLTGYPNQNLKAMDKLATSFYEFKISNEMDLLPTYFSALASYSPELQSSPSAFQFAGRTIDEDIRTLGINEYYLGITGAHLKKGKNISPYHVRNASAVCLIGSKVAERLFKDIEPLGQVIIITGESYPCRVIGVLADMKKTETGDSNLLALMPYTYFRNVNSGRERLFRRFVLQAKEPDKIAPLMKALKGYFKRKYGKSGVIETSSNLVLVEQMRRFMNLFSVMLSIVAFISLMVGGIGIHNMMLISVNERFREIGLLKAIGATSSSIRIHFLVETMILCSLAGLAGVVFGFCGYQALIYALSLIVPKIQFEWVINGGAIQIALFSTIVIGLLSGLTPAIKAEKLDVISALRSE